MMMQIISETNLTIKQRVSCSTITKLVFIFCLSNFSHFFLSVDWTQCTDASSGHPYYWNIVTKEVTWEMPIEYQQFLDQAMLRNSNVLRKWTLCYTDDSAPYYFNEVTREISWEKPEDFISNDTTNNKKGESGHSNSGNNDNVSASRYSLKPSIKGR